MSNGRRDGSISHLILFLTGNTLRLELEYCGTNAALLRVIMKNEDVTYGEIAKELGCPLGTVMSRLFYARKNLKKES